VPGSHLRWYPALHISRPNIYRQQPPEKKGSLLL
jgi:hypothetical protein